MLNRGYTELGIWNGLRRRSVKRFKLVQLMDGMNSELLAIYAIGSLVPLNVKNRKRMIQLAKHLRWLQRIYAGMWPWGVNT